MNADSARLATVIVEIRRVMRRKSAAEHGKDARSPAEREVLRYLGSNPGAGTAQIAAALRLRANTISGIVSGLTRAGLLTRTQAPHDARASRFYLGVDAEAQRLARWEGRSDVLDGALVELDAADRAAIAAAIPALERLAEGLARREADQRISSE